MTSPPARSLPVVLRALTTGPGTALRLIVGVYGEALSGAEGRTYAMVWIGSEQVRVPKLAGVTHGAAGQPAYVLADQGRMLVIGTVSN